MEAFNLGKLVHDRMTEHPSSGNMWTGHLSRGSQTGSRNKEERSGTRDDLHRYIL